MTTSAAKLPRAVRSKRLEACVDQHIFDAVEQLAIKNGRTLSSALYFILIEWEQRERAKISRKNKVC